MNTVSVCMITYGHEKYIREAIDGVLKQEMDGFSLELIIANDCSPDLTDAIVNEYIKTHDKGHLIKYFKHEKNLGIMPNFLFALDKCEGDYIAICEGDDYWLTTDKLKKQVAFLNEHPDYGLVYTHVKHYDQSKQAFVEVAPRFVKKEEDTLPTMLKSKFIEFATTLFRRDVFFEALETVKPELAYGVIGDTRILLETAFISKIHFLNEVTTVYRFVLGSASRQIKTDSYIYALLDTYNCRKTFVQRNNLNTSWLASSVCNTNRGLINHAFVARNYRDVLKLLKPLKLSDTFKYCDIKTFIAKITPTIVIKFAASILGIGVLKQRLKNT